VKTEDNRIFQQTELTPNQTGLSWKGYLLSASE